MHSWPIMVESMSVRRSFLRRPTAGCTMTSAQAPASAAYTLLANARASPAGALNGISAAMAGASQTGAFAAGRALWARSMARTSSPPGDAEIRVATRLADACSPDIKPRDDAEPRWPQTAPCGVLNAGQRAGGAAADARAGNATIRLRRRQARRGAPTTPAALPYPHQNGRAGHDGHRPRW